MLREEKGGGGLLYTCSDPNPCSGLKSRYTINPARVYIYIYYIHLFRTPIHLEFGGLLNLHEHYVHSTLARLEERKKILPPTS